MEHHKQMLWRTYLLLGILYLLGVLIIGRLFQIQFIEGNYWKGLASETYIDSIAAPRGQILTENGDILSMTMVHYTIAMDPSSSGMDANIFAQEVDSLGWYIHQYLNKEKSAQGWSNYLREQRKKGVQYVEIAKGVDIRDLEMVRKFPIFRYGQFKGGLLTEGRDHRYKPFGDLARRTIGGMVDGRPHYGLEASYNDFLFTGYHPCVMRKVGKKRFPVHDISDLAPDKKAKDIVTTLDMGMQDMVHSRLKASLIQHQAQSGVVAIMEVKTGKIRALVNLDKDGDDYTEQYNHAVGTRYEMGSVFKLATMMALLEDGHISPDDLVDIQKGQMKFYNHILRDSEPHQLDTVTVREAFEKSSNVGMAKLVTHYYGKNPSNFVSKIKKFGFNERTGIDLLGEKDPIIHEPGDKVNWSGITLPWMAMGYEVAVTPIQMLAFYAAVANNGKLLVPRVVSSLQLEGKPTRYFHPKTKKYNIASRKTIKQLQEMLEGVVMEGTAKAQRRHHYKFAGKTGTAKILDKEGNLIGHRASFVGYFPTEEPIYAMIVLINEPHNGAYYGSELALPVFADIADYCFQSRMEMFKSIEDCEEKEGLALNYPQWEAGLRKDYKKIARVADIPYDQDSDTEWTVTKVAASGKFTLLDRQATENQVPNVLGMGLRDALYLLEQAGLRTDVNGVGKVIRQSIKPGTLANGQYVRIILE